MSQHVAGTLILKDNRHFLVQYYNTIQHNTTQRNVHNTTQHNATQRNATQRNATQRNTTLFYYASHTLFILINYSCSSYPTRASYSGQVDGFRNPMENELKRRPCLKPMFETISNTDANFLNLHIDKATKTRDDKQLYLITQFTKQTLNLNYLLLKLNVTEQFLKNPKQKRPFFLNSRSMMATSCFGSLSTLLYTSDQKWH